MEMQELISFSTIVEQKSFSRAAAKLGYSKASVSVHIKNLEEELDVRLFDRIGKQVSLTEQGRKLYQHTLNIFKELQAARTALSQSEELTGTLVIGTIDSISSDLLADKIQYLKEMHPKMKFVIKTDTISGLLHMMDTNDVDLVYLYDYEIKNADYVKVYQRREKTAFVIATNSAIGRQSEITLEDMGNLPLILTEKDASYRQQADRFFIENLISPEVFLETKDTNLIKRLLLSDMGVSFLPEYIVRDEVDRGNLAMIAPEQIMGSRHQMEDLYVQVLHHKDKWITEEMRAFFGSFS